MTWVDEPTAPGERMRCAIYTCSNWAVGAVRWERSAAAQHEVCCRYLTREHGLTVLRQRYDDRDDVLVGSRGNRPALQRLLDDIARGQIDIVAVLRADRLSGSPMELALLMERLDAAGVALLAIDRRPSSTTFTCTLTINLLRGLGNFAVVS